eukprot:4704598-Amphidinium_carterae.1
MHLGGVHSLVSCGALRLQLRYLTELVDMGHSQLLHKTSMGRPSSYQNPSKAKRLDDVRKASWKMHKSNQKN